MFETFNSGSAMAQTEQTLTPKQALFVKEYLVDLNATQATIRCGYSKKTAKQQGSRLYTNAVIQAAITRGREERAARVELTADSILADLQEIKERCMLYSAITVWDMTEKRYVPIRDADVIELYTFDARGAIRAAKLMKTTSGNIASFARP